MKKKILKLQKDTRHLKTAIRAAGKLHTTNDSIGFLWQIDGLAMVVRIANEIRNAYPTNLEIRKAVAFIQTDASEAETLTALAARDESEIYLPDDFDIDLPDYRLETMQKALGRAASAGARLMALMNAVSWRAEGKTERPEWKYIRPAWDDALKKDKKPYQPDVISDGLKRFEAATGRPSERTWDQFTRHFKEMVIDK